MNDRVVRFGVFAFTPSTGELLRDGTPLKLQTQPARVLAVLLAQAGQTVTRETLQREVWGEGTHVDFERGLNLCIAQVRAALRDSADSPRYIATVPRVGYRFIAPFNGIPSATTAEKGVVEPVNAAEPPRGRHRTALALAALVLLLLGTATWNMWRLDKSRAVPTIVVVPFYNETGSPEMDLVAKGTSDATVARLATPATSRA